MVQDYRATSLPGRAGGSGGGGDRVFLLCRPLAPVTPMGGVDRGAAGLRAGHLPADERKR